MSWLVVGFGVGSVMSALGPGRRNDVSNFQVAEVDAGTFRDLFHGLVKIRISWFRQVGANQEVAERHRFLVGLSQLSSQQDSGLFGEVGGRLKSKGIVVDELLGSLCFDVVGAASIPLQSPFWGLRIVLGSRRVTESVRPAKDAWWDQPRAAKMATDRSELHAPSPLTSPSSPTQVGENDEHVHESDHAVAIEIFVGWRWWWWRWRWWRRVAHLRENHAAVGANADLDCPSRHTGWYRC